MPSLPKMTSYDNWLYAIPPFFICFSFVVVIWQRILESRIEKREHELRMQREGNGVNLMKYFKKS